MINDEIPDSQQGIILYFNYCKKQIKRNLNMNIGLKKRIELCIEKANKIGLKLKD